MIYFLKGVIEELGDDYAALDVNGVGYQAFMSSKALSRIGVGEVTKLYIYTHVREAEFSLFGFQTAAERGTFMMLTSVSGVGPKVGLAILSALEAEEIVSAITMQEGKVFARASGVGPKLGERIVMELKGKVGSMPIAAIGATGAKVVSGTASEVVSALTNLGYKALEANKAVSSASETLGEAAAFDVLFKASLQELR